MSTDVISNLIYSSEIIGISCGFATSQRRSLFEWHSVNLLLYSLFCRPINYKWKLCQLLRRQCGNVCRVGDRSRDHWSVTWLTSGDKLYPAPHTRRVAIGLVRGIGPNRLSARGNRTWLTIAGRNEHRPKRARNMAPKAIGELFIGQENTGHVTRIIAREARECKLAEINNNFDYHYLLALSWSSLVQYNDTFNAVKNICRHFKTQLQK